MTSTPASFVLITGGVRGIGRALAERFAAAGCQVGVVARTADALQQQAAEWAQRFPQQPLLTCAADLQTPAGRQAVTRMGWPPVDVLIHNVGAYEVGNLLDAPPQQLDDMLQINLLAAHHLTHHFVPGMVQRGRGHVFTIGSVAALDLPAGFDAYTLSKVVLHHWARFLHRQLTSTGVHTTLVAPGATYTSSWEGQDVDPTTLLQPAEVAEAIYDVWASPHPPLELVLRPPG